MIINESKLGKNSLKNLLPAIIILIPLFWSIFNAVTNTIKYDKHYINLAGNEVHKIIKSDIHNYWSQAHEFKNDIDNGKEILKSGGEFERSYLYPKIIALYHLITNQNIKDENNKYVTGNNKYWIPIIQSLIFYLVLLMVYKKLILKFDYITANSILLFLAIEPTLFQFHGSYWSETLYFSLILLIFIFFFDLPKSYLKYLGLGLLVGISYMQRSPSLLLFIPISFYFLVILKSESVKKIFFLMFGFVIILFFIGFNNYKRSNIFYFIPFTQSEAHWNYVAHKLNADKLGISEKKSLERKYDNLDLFISEKNLDPNKLEDKLEINKYKRNYFFDSFKNNFFVYIKLHLWKSMHASILDFKYVKKSYWLDKSMKDYWKHEKFVGDLKFNIIYSLIVYSISLLGMILMIKKGTFERNLSFLIILFCLYNIGILGWVGTTRYLAVNLLFISIFFGNGLSFFIKKYLLRHNYKE